MSIPNTHVRSAPAERICGMMVDAARQPGTVASYHRLIDVSAARGLNTLLFRLCDDQGCAVRFESRPGLVTHQQALNKADSYSASLANNPAKFAALVKRSA